MELTEQTEFVCLLYWFDELGPMGFVRGEYASVPEPMAELGSGGCARSWVIGGPAETELSGGDAGAHAEVGLAELSPLSMADYLAGRKPAPRKFLSFVHSKGWPNKVKIHIARRYTLGRPR